MAAPVPLLPDFDAASLRALAKSSRDSTQTRRLLALSMINAGGLGSEATAIRSGGLQTVPDRVTAFNAHSPDGLIDGKPPRAPARLNAERQVRR